MDVNITESASAQISKLCTGPNKAVRLAILSGGCNGFTKTFDLVTEIESDDTVFECNNGKLVIDSLSLEFLDNSTIDYKNDLIGAFFTVIIPTATSSCGCGTSFSI
jgi:iron-sulfur cluster assembly accessory protein